MGGVGCAHGPRPEVARPAAEMRCDDALATLVQHPAAPPAGDGIRRSVTTPLSWLAIGAGYTVDVTALAAGSIVGGVVVCLPVMAVEAGLHGSGDTSSGCVSSVSGTIWDDGELLGAGKGLKSVTRPWRCPNFTRRVAEVRMVAACLAVRNAPGDLAAARALLLPLTDHQVASCIQPSDQAAIEVELLSLMERDHGPWGDTAPANEPPGIPEGSAAP
jgi:hypothetical protein